MLENVQLGFGGKNHMVFSACRNCSCFRGIVVNGKSGFCCAEGDVDGNFISFDYPCMDGEGRLEQILGYQENDLPDNCPFHTQCSMLNWMEDESVVNGIALEGLSIVEAKAGDVDFREPVLSKAIERDSGLVGWCSDHPDATVVFLERDGKGIGFAILTSERDGDYSWIHPSPPDRHYLQKGSDVVGIRVIWADGNDSFNVKLLVGMAYRKAIEEGATDFYAIAYEDACGILMNCGFRSAGYFLGGDGSDEEKGAFVMVKKVNDLEVV